MSAVLVAKIHWAEQWAVYIGMRWLNPLRCWWESAVDKGRIDVKLHFFTKCLQLMLGSEYCVLWEYIEQYNSIDLEEYYNLNEA